MYIKEVAEKTNLEPHTIRYYEQEGLLPFMKGMNTVIEFLKKMI